MNFINCIYKLTSPSNKVYIGQALNFNRRMLAYKNLRCKKQKHLYSALLKYGFESFNVEVVCNNLPIEDMNDIETLLIAEYNSANNEKGYNICVQGGSSKGLKRPEGWVDPKKGKLRYEGDPTKDPRYGKKLTEEHKKNLSISHMGIKSRTGILHSEESKKKMSLATKDYLSKHPHPQKGVPMTKEKYEKCKKSMFKPLDIPKEDIDENNVIREVIPKCFTNTKLSSWHKSCRRLYNREYARKKSLYKYLL